MTRKDKDKDKDKEGRAVHKGLFQKCKKTKWQKMSLLGERHISQKHVSTWIFEDLKSHNSFVEKRDWWEMIFGTSRDFPIAFKIGNWDF